jgi:hypothetical protein
VNENKKKRSIKCFIGFAFGMVSVFLNGHTLEADVCIR